MFGFLQSCSDNSFRRELDALGRELPVPATQLGPELPVLAAQWEAYDELQTDGNRSSHSRMVRIEAGRRPAPPPSPKLGFSVARYFQGASGLEGTPGLSLRLCSFSYHVGWYHLTT